MLRQTFFALSFAALLIAPPSAQAIIHTDGDAAITLSVTEVYTSSSWTHETTYAQRAFHKLGFGLKNLFLGWTDLFTEPFAASKADENVIAATFVGIKDALENTLGGAVHLVTFPITGLDAPLPEGGTEGF